VGQLRSGEEADRRGSADAGVRHSEEVAATRRDEASAGSGRRGTKKEAPKPEAPRSETAKPQVAKTEAPKAEQPKPEAPKEAPKVEAPKAAGLPSNGQELHRRLREYETKLVAQKVCTVGQLLSHVTQAGVKAGYSANMSEWTGPALPFAVDAVKEFEQIARQSKAEPRNAA